MDEDIEKIYGLSVKLYYKYANNNMLACGHPGVLGTNGDEEFNADYGKLAGAVETLRQVLNVIKK